MQTCSVCNASSPDNALTCIHCGVKLSEFSVTSVALKHLQENPRVRLIRVSVAGDACPHCYELLKTYPKNKVPRPAARRLFQWEWMSLFLRTGAGRYGRRWKSSRLN